MAVYKGTSFCRVNIRGIATSTRTAVLRTVPGRNMRRSRVADRRSDLISVALRLFRGSEFCEIHPSVTGTDVYSVHFLYPSCEAAPERTSDSALRLWILLLAIAKHPDFEVIERYWDPPAVPQLATFTIEHRLGSATDADDYAYDRDGGDEYDDQKIYFDHDSRLQPRMLSQTV